MYYVYLLQCGDNSIYTGITTDLARRLQEHKDGSGGHYTHAHGAKKILHTEKYFTRSEALRREAEIKGLTREEKLTLVKNGSD
jgi:putative endonuclease